MESLRKKNKTEFMQIKIPLNKKYNWNVRAWRQNRDSKEKKKNQKNSDTKDSRSVKGICKNSATPSKDQTCESMKKKRSKPKLYVI
jgi:hypothetical protein